MNNIAKICMGLGIVVCSGITAGDLNIDRDKEFKKMAKGQVGASSMAELYRYLKIDPQGSTKLLFDVPKLKKDGLKYADEGFKPAPAAYGFIEAVPFTIPNNLLIDAAQKMLDGSESEDESKSDDESGE
jgi:hypothetical protein